LKIGAILRALILKGKPAMPRSSFQHGSVIKVQQKAGAIWRYRYRDGAAQRSEFLGTLAQLPTKAAAEKTASAMLALINGPRSECITIANLIDRFLNEAMPTRPATAHSYQSILKRVRSDWGDTRIDQFISNIMAVQNWLESLTVIGRHPKPGRQALVSPMYRGQVRNVLHMLFEQAMLWQVVAIDRNPISLLKAKDASKRTKDLTILTLEQYQALLADPQLPLLVKTLIQVCAGLGLRISEALGLRWDDLNFDEGELRIRRSVVNGVAGETKTKGSAAKLPLHPEIIGVLRSWRVAEAVVGGWVFGSERNGKPWDRDHLRDTYLKPAGERAGCPEIGWHSLRHSYRANLRESNVPIETQKSLMRHSRIATTMDTYGGSGNVDSLRPANSKVVEMLHRRSA
jgi:integrase